MSCDALLALIALASPHQVEEHEVRLAIDILANGMRHSQKFKINNLDEHTRKALLILLADHPDLSAVSIDGEILIQKRRTK